MITKIKLSVLIVSFVTAIWFFGTSTFSTASALTAAESSSPRSLYLQNCATCHGSNGKAQTKRGLKLGATDLTSEDVQSMDRAKIIRAITAGRPGMPSFKKKLTTRQIAQIADYIYAF